MRAGSGVVLLISMVTCPSHSGSLEAGVLCAPDLDFARQAMATTNNETVHE